jgi:pimeloyl-ACP methyl ester carboxylesterase
VIAPGRSVLGFDVKTLQGIESPIQIFGGDADVVAPAVECCGWLHQSCPNSRLEILPGAGHYTFLPEGTEVGVQVAPELFYDKPGLNRRGVHEYVASCVADYSERVP